MTEMTCIVCPIGCSLEITGESDNYVVRGNNCPRGAKYAIQELTNPTRTLTTILPTDKGNIVSVKSSSPLPKDKIFDAMKALAKITVNEPVKIGDVILENIVDTGINIVATKNIGE